MAPAVSQASFAVRYKGQYLGEYFAGILIEDVLDLELKCVERLCDEQMAQCLNYLRASGQDVCRLINFRKPRAEWKRIASGYNSAEPVETPL